MNLAVPTVELLFGRKSRLLKCSAEDYERWFAHSIVRLLVATARSQSQNRVVPENDEPAGALPDHLRPLVTEPFGTDDLPPLPQRDRRLAAHLWREAPAELLTLGADFGESLVTYKRRIGRWYLWRAGPAAHGDARYGALDADDLTRMFTFRLDPDGHGVGTGPDSVTHTRFRTWKESLRDN